LVKDVFTALTKLTVQKPYGLIEEGGKVAQISWGKSSDWNSKNSINV